MLTPPRRPLGRTSARSSARTVARSLVGLAVTGGLLMLPMTGADAVGSKPASPAGGQHSTRAFGSGTMGWRDKAAQSAVPSLRARTATSTKRTTVSGILGVDVAGYQGNVNWTSTRAAGKQFAYVKATEGTSFRNSYFGSQYTGAYKAGMYHGAYHFAIPNGRGGAAQADYFVAHGGGWSRDGRTLPGVLDIEYNPYGSTCYGLSQSAMVSWIRAFTREYKLRTTRDAVIYSTTDWWTRCTGNSSAFSSTNPLWIARYSSSAGTLPHNWRWYTFWQYSGTGTDQDTFNGSSSRLKALALG